MVRIVSLNELPWDEHIVYLEKQRNEIIKLKYLTPFQFKTLSYLNKEISRLKESKK